MTEQELEREKESYEAIIRSLEKSKDDHQPGLDGWLYNAGTVVTLMLTAVVSVISGNVFTLDEDYRWLPSALSAAVGLLVALERSLGFGPRWRFHTEMRTGYTTVIDMIQFYFAIPVDQAEQRTKMRAEIWQSLNALRSRESAIPNSGGTVSGGG